MKRRRHRKHRMRGVEHTGEWEYEEGPVSRYRDANSVGWNVEEVLGEWSASIMDAVTDREASKTYAVRSIAAGSKDELRGKIDRVADDAWNAGLAAQAKKSSGSGVVLLLAALAFGGKKNKRRARR